MSTGTGAAPASLDLTSSRLSLHPVSAIRMRDEFAGVGAVEAYDPGGLPLRERFGISRIWTPEIVAEPSFSDRQLTPASVLLAITTHDEPRVVLT